MHKLTYHSRGFSLAELAIVLLVISILSAGVIGMLRVQREHAAISETRLALDGAKEALYAFAEVNVGLPCPDVDNDGIADPPCSAIKNRRGTLPWKTLGLVRGDDGWQRSLHYLVSPNFVVGTLKNLQQDGSIEIQGDTALGVPDARAFAIWSLGPDGMDASASEAANSNVVQVGATAAPADDIVIWGSRFTMVGRILQAGQTLTLN